MVAVQWQKDHEGQLGRVADINPSGDVVSIVCVGEKRTGPLVSKFGKRYPLDFVSKLGGQFIVPATGHYMFRDKIKRKDGVPHPLRQEFLHLMNMWSEAAIATVPQSDHNFAETFDNSMCQLCQNIGGVGLGPIIHCPICLLDCHSVCLSVVDEYLDGPEGRRFASRLPSVSSSFQLPEIFNGRS